MKCILCQKDNNKILEVILVKDLIALYQKEFNYNISYLLNTQKIYYKECNYCGLKYFDPPITGDEAFYNLYQTKNTYYLDDKEEYHFAAKYIHQSDSVLEIGSGIGNFSTFLNTKSYTGLEFNQNAVLQGQKKNINILQQTIEEHALKNKEKYDVVISFQVMEHVSDIYSFIKNSLVCLKEKGLFIVTVPNNNSYLKYLVNAISNIPPHHLSRWEDKAFISLKEIFNLKLIKMHYENLNPIHKETYICSVAYHTIAKLFSYPIRIINLNLKHKIITKLAKIYCFFGKKVISNKSNLYGHSITVIYKK